MEWISCVMSDLPLVSLTRRVKPWLFIRNDVTAANLPNSSVQLRFVDSLHCFFGAGCIGGAMLWFVVGIGVDALVDGGTEVVVVSVVSSSEAGTMSSVAAWRSQWNWNSCCCRSGSSS